jgi:hypothetical protein
MGYRGKVVEQERARELRASGWTYTEITAELGVSKSSVSLWCRDVPVDEAVWSARARANRNEGGKGDGWGVRFANSDTRMVALFMAWFRTFVDVDESRLRLRLYLHQGLDVDAANRFWSDVTAIPTAQFTRPYRAVADPSIRRSKHEHGCATVVYSSLAAHRLVMGMVDVVLSATPFRGSSAGRAVDC